MNFKDAFEANIIYNVENDQRFFSEEKMLLG